MSSGERSLQARSLIEIHEDRSISLHPVLVAFVGPCTHPELSVMVTRAQPESASETHYFHNSKQMFVEHTMQLNGLHTFKLLTGQDDFVETIGKILVTRWDDGNHRETSPISMTEEDLAQIRAYIQAGDRGKAQDLLSGSASDLPVKALLLDDLADPQANSSIAVLQHESEGSDTVMIEGLGILEGKDRLWMIIEDGVPVAEGEKHLAIKIANAEHIHQKIRQMLLPIK
jgi:hypothetical protein